MHLCCWNSLSDSYYTINDSSLWDTQHPLQCRGSSRIAREPLHRPSLLLHVTWYAVHTLTPRVNRFRSIRPPDGEADPLLSGLPPGDETRALPDSNRVVPLHLRCHSGKCWCVELALLRHDGQLYSKWCQPWILAIEGKCCRSMLI